MEDVLAEYVTSTVEQAIPADRPLDQSMTIDFDMALDAAAALRQEQQFHRELVLLNETLRAAAAEDAVGPKVEMAGPAILQSPLGRTADDDSAARLRALAARNAYLMMSLEAATAEIATLKAESQQLHAEFAEVRSQQVELQVELADWRQRQGQAQADLNSARVQVQRLESDNGNFARVQAERDQLQHDLAVARTEAESRLTASSTASRNEIAALRSTLAQSETARERLDERLLAAQSDILRMEEECKRLIKQEQLAQQALNQLRARDTRQSDTVEVQRLRARIEAQTENRQHYVQDLHTARQRIAELEALCRKFKQSPAVT